MHLVNKVAFDRAPVPAVAIDDLRLRATRLEVHPNDTRIFFTAPDASGFWKFRQMKTSCIELQSYCPHSERAIHSIRKFSSSCQVIFKAKVQYLRKFLINLLLFLFN